MPRIFISYRRDDAGYVAGMLADRLRATFGPSSVFIDIDTIPLGVDFRKHIHDAVGQCDVLLAIIGDNWFAKTGDTSKRRIDDISDFVRLELEAALNRGIPVIPVLVGNARMPPPHELPTALESFAFRNATELRSGRDMNHHIDVLIRGLGAHHLAAGPSPPIAPDASSPEIPAPSPPKGTVVKEWRASYNGNHIRVTNWWTVSGDGEARLYINGNCVDTTSRQSLRGTVWDDGGTEHVVYVRFGGLLSVKADLFVDGEPIGIESHGAVPSAPSSSEDEPPPGGV